MEKFRETNIHNRRKPLEQSAKEINLVLCDIINYYHHFWKDGYAYGVVSAQCTIAEMDKMGKGFV